MSSKNKDKKPSVQTEIQTEYEVEQEIDLTMNEIEAEKAAKARGKLSEEEIKAAIERINPDEGTKDRG